jgi:plastocyanin
VNRSARLATALFAALMWTGIGLYAAWAADREISITIKDHRFDPAEVRIKAGERVVLLVRNADGSAEEFESDELKIEKIIPANREAKFRVGPLKAGTYKFFGEFHEDTAQGRLVVE